MLVSSVLLFLPLILKIEYVHAKILGLGTPEIVEDFDFAASFGKSKGFHRLTTSDVADKNSLLLLSRTLRDMKVG